MFGRYELLDRIGLGGMAEVWRARVGGVGGFEKIVVIKKILPSFASNKTFIDMLLAEARLCAVLQHANIVQTYENGETDGMFYISMEYVPGHDLFKVLSRATQSQNRIPPELCLYIAAEAAKGLHYAHNAKDHYGRPLNIIHRDVSPSNIILSEGGEVKVMDFGVAKASPGGQRDNATRSGVLKGKLGYMSPEQVTGRAFDHRSDIFSLGIILYESLTLKRLFLAKTDLETLVNIRDARIEHKFKKHSYIDEDIRDILRRALAREPADRYPTALAMHDDIMKVMFDRRQHVSGGHLARYLEALFEAAPNDRPANLVTAMPVSASGRPASKGLDLLPDSAVVPVAAGATAPPLLNLPASPGHGAVNPASPKPVSTEGLHLPGTPGSNSLSFSPEDMRRIRHRIEEQRAQQGLPPLPSLEGDGAARPTQPQDGGAPGSDNAAPELSLGRPTTPIAGVRAPGATQPPPTLVSPTPVRVPAVDGEVRAPSPRPLAATKQMPARPSSHPSDSVLAAVTSPKPAIAAPEEPSGIRPRPVEFAIASAPKTDPHIRAGTARAMRPDLQTAPFDSAEVKAGLNKRPPSGDNAASVAEVELSAPVISSTDATVTATPAETLLPLLPEQVEHQADESQAIAPGLAIPTFDSPQPSRPRGDFAVNFLQERLTAPIGEPKAETSSPVSLLEESSGVSQIGLPGDVQTEAEYDERSEQSYNIAGPQRSPSPNYRLRMSDGTEMTGLTVTVIEGMLRNRTATVDDMVAYGDGPFLPVRSLASLKSVVDQVIEERPPPSLSGPLSQWIFVRLIYKMFADRATGCLELQRGDAIKTIYFRRGRVQYIASNQHQELLGPFMVANGYISQADIDMAVSRSRSTGTKLGDLLIGMNLVKPFQLYQVLERQMRAKFIDAFGWDTGGYAFFDGVDPPQDVVPLDFDPISVLGEGVRERVSLAVLEPLFQDKLDRPIYPCQKGLIAMADLKLQARESKAVSLLFSAPTPRQAYEECYNNRQQRLAFLHVMFLLLQTELITFDPQRA